MFLAVGILHFSPLQLMRRGKGGFPAALCLVPDAAALLPGLLG